MHCQSGVLVCRAAIPGAGFGEKKARAILEYRLAHGRFQSLDEVAQVPGVTQDMIDEWQGLAYVS